MLEHFIAILDSELREVLNFSKREEITKDFVTDLMKVLKMAPLAECKIYNATDNQFPGWSFIQPITTSHISGHYFYDTVVPQIHIDIYSCKNFIFKDAFECANKHFGIKKWSGDFIVRTIEDRKIQSFGSAKKAL